VGVGVPVVGVGVIVGVGVGNVGGGVRVGDAVGVGVTGTREAITVVVDPAWMKAWTS